MGQILALFHFFQKIGLGCRKIEASQGFWYQGVGADMLFQNSLPPICITIDVPVIAHFPKFSGRPSLETRASLEKNYIFGILVERAINSVNFV